MGQPAGGPSSQHPASAPVGQPAGPHSFPEAARAALQDSQLRHNVGKATTTIRAKRAQAVA
ncbi:MAG: hypothetical protein V7607_2218, partial [Solirubrobacteraceae bacterium]